MNELNGKKTKAAGSERTTTVAGQTSEMKV